MHARPHSLDICVRFRVNWFSCECLYSDLHESHGFTRSQVHSVTRYWHLTLKIYDFASNTFKYTIHPLMLTKEQPHCTAQYVLLAFFILYLNSNAVEEGKRGLEKEQHLNLHASITHTYSLFSCPIKRTF